MKTGNIIWWLIGGVWLTCLCACSDNNNNPPKETDAKSVTILTSLNGAGDNGYNDLVVSGFMKFYNAHPEVALSMLHPTTMDDASRAIQNWLKESADKPDALLVLAASEYETLLANSSVKLKGNQQILLFESTRSDFPEGVTTFHIQRYGVCYLAGCMARKHSEAAVIAAMPNDQTLKDATEGFTKGYREQGGEKITTYFLAEDASGYAMPDSAYRMASQLSEAFILPLAGGSNNGIFKYSREQLFDTMLVVGMDVDCAALSKRIPFSIVLRMDELLEYYLNTWLTEEKFPASISYGLESDYVDIVISSLFDKWVDVWEEYYEDPDFWINSYQEYKDKAIEEEKRYEME